MSGSNLAGSSGHRGALQGIGVGAATVVLLGILLLGNVPVPESGAPAQRVGPNLRIDVAAGTLEPSSCLVAGCTAVGASVPLAIPPMAWSNVTASYPTAPPPLAGGRLVFDPVDHYLVLFGGCDGARCPAPAQTWTFTGAAGWTNITNQSVQPPARSDAMMVFDDGNGTVLLFGGVGVGNELLGDTWGFVGGHWTNLTGALAPSPRHGGGMAYDLVDSQVVLYGGCGRPCPLGDTWTYNASGWRNVSGSVGAAPLPRWGAAFTYDQSDDYVLLVDGCGATTCPLNDSWSFSGGRWTSLSPSLPPKRFDAGMIFVAGPNVTYLYGGNVSNRAASDTWRYGGGKWTNVTSVLGLPPSARSAVALVPTTDAWPAGVEQTWPFGLLFGGSPSACSPCAGPALADTWVLERLLTPFLAATPTIPEVGQPVTFSATSTGGTAPFNFTLAFGDGSGAAGSTGAHSYAQSGLVAARVTVLDGAGVKATGTTLVSVVLGPIVSVTVLPNPLDAGQTVNFSSSTTGGSPSYAYRWTFGDGTNGTAASAAHSYPQPGSYAVHLVVTDAVGGVGSWSGTVVAHPVLVLTAAAAPSSVAAGGPVEFTATPTAGTAPYTVSWIFGDGTNGSGIVFRHTYAVRGNYTVEATVVDAAGSRVTQTLTVMVGPAAPGGGSGFRWTLTSELVVLVAGVAVAAAAGWWYRRRTRRPPPAPLAAAGVGDPDWTEADRSPRRRNATAAAREARNWPRR